MTQYAQPRRLYGGNPAGAGSSFLWGMGHAGRKKKEQQQMLLEMFKAGFIPKKSDKPKAGGWRGAMQNIAEAWSPRMPEFEMAPHHPVMAGRETQKSTQEHEISLLDIRADLNKEQEERQYQYDLDIQRRAFTNDRRIALAKEHTTRLGQLIEKELGKERNAIALRDVQNQEIKTIIQGLLAESGVNLDNANIEKLGRDQWFVIRSESGAIMMNQSTGEWKGVNTRKGGTGFFEGEVISVEQAARRGSRYLLDRAGAYRLNNDVKMADHLTNQYKMLDNFLLGFPDENLPNMEEILDSGILEDFGYNSLGSGYKGFKDDYFRKKPWVAGRKITGAVDGEHEDWGKIRDGYENSEVDAVAADIDEDSMPDEDGYTRPSLAPELGVTSSDPSMMPSLADYNRMNPEFVPWQPRMPLGATGNMMPSLGGGIYNPKSSTSWIQPATTRPMGGGPPPNASMMGPTSSNQRLLQSLMQAAQSARLGGIKGRQTSVPTGRSIDEILQRLQNAARQGKTPVPGSAPTIN